ncbi:MAG TPA: hypothetical protein VE977_06975, partial [Pyrinomonadaceae bacterium]|nr:hypothetical protein [Pyrinomonadaceae bacterium]
MPEAKESLERLAGKDKLETMRKKATDELRDSRTIRLGPATANLKGATEAQFYVALTQGPSRMAKATEVKFISGDEKLRALASILKGGNF